MGMVKYVIHTHTKKKELHCVRLTNEWTLQLTMKQASETNFVDIKLLNFVMFFFNVTSNFFA